MSLTPQQVAQFEEEGWLDLGCVLSQQEIAAHRAAYDSCLAALAETHAGENNVPDISRPPRPGLRVHQIRAAHLQHDIFAELIRRRSITDAVASLVADDLKIILCQGLYKPPHIGGELNWHQVGKHPHTLPSHYSVPCTSQPIHPHLTLITGACLTGRCVL